MTEHLKLSGSAGDEAAITRTAEALSQGGIVAVPTDTVYGLACRSAFPDSIRRIYDLKGRPSDKPLPWLIPDADAVFSFVNEIPRRALRLINRFWPGPLTVVLGGAQSIAVRLPDHPALREILRRAGGPVVATSANPSGAKAAVTPEEVAASFEGRVDVILDGGPSRLARESSIVQVLMDESATIIREGQIASKEIREALAVSILLICTGNSCRSPMAEAILTRDLSQHVGVPGNQLLAHGFVVGSAGVGAPVGAPASAGAVEAARRAGLNLEKHRARQVTRALLAEADHVFAMSYEHVLRLRQLFGPDAERVKLLDPDGRDVADPFGGPVEDYLQCFRLLEGLIRARIPEIAAGLPVGPPAKNF